MDIVSIGPVSGGPKDLREQLARVGQRLSGKKLGIVYLPIDSDHRSWLRAASEGLQAPIVGATTGGAAFTERGVTRGEPVAAVLGGPSFDFEVSEARDLGRDVRASVSSAVRALVVGARRRMMRFQSVLTLADAFACDGEALLDALQGSTPPHWRLFGGTAGDDWTFRGTRIFSGQEILEGAAVMVGLFTDVAPSIAAHHGFCAVDAGRELTITEIEGNRLKKLDDAPAAEVYSGELVRLGLMRPGTDPVPVMAKHELGAKTMHGELKIRAPLGVEDGGVVRLASSLPVGTIVRVVTASADQLMDAARNVSTRALETFDGRAVRGALVFDCAARLQLLGPRYSQQVTAFLGGRNFPMVGMACYAEIAKFGGSIEGFHNTTAVMAAW